MSEIFISPDLRQPITRQQVIDAYKKFVERGVTSPDILDENEPEVKVANDLFLQWVYQEDKQAAEAPTKDDREAHYRNNFSKTMLYIDAGFTDQNYLEEVLGWLMQDAQNIEKQPEDQERIKTRQQIANAIKKVRGLLEKKKA